MISPGVPTHGVILGGSLVVVGSFPGTITRVVVDGHSMGGALARPLSSWLVSEIGSVSLWLLFFPSPVGCLAW